jgi:hypothetical protein
MAVVTAVVVATRDSGGSGDSSGGTGEVGIFESDFDFVFIPFTWQQSKTLKSCCFRFSFGTDNALFVSEYYANLYTRYLRDNCVK